jgi:hypothetical protein
MCSYNNIGLKEGVLYLRTLRTAVATATIAAFLAVVYALTKVVKAAPAASCEARAGEAQGS